MTLLEAVVEWHLLEVNLAGFPECLLALLLLAGEELGDVGVVALRHVLVPALLHLVVLHVVHILHLSTKNGKVLSFVLYICVSFSKKSYYTLILVKRPRREQIIEHSFSPL